MEALKEAPPEAQIPDDVPDSGAPADQPKPHRTLADLFAEMRHLESIIDEPDFDPAQLVGPLELPHGEAAQEIRDSINSKVDSIDYVVSEFRAYAERTKIRAKRLARRAAAADYRADLLEIYVLCEMERQGVERLSGIERKIERRRSSMPRLVLLRDRPTDADMLAFGETWIRHIPERLEWRNDVVKQSLKNGGECDFATLQYSHFLAFDDRDQPDVGKKKKGKK